MNKLSICIWFDGQIEEAARYYTGVFKDSKFLNESKFLGEAPGGKKEGEPLVCELEIMGINFQLLNGGNFFKVSEAVSFVVNCENQEEVDYYWEKLSHVKESEQCGWCKDRFGVSWQIVPKQLTQLMNSNDIDQNKRVWKAMMEMKKLSIADLEKAARGAE